MKFAQYLETNCTQEWKRAYIDYKRLKKAIKAVAVAQAERESAETGAPLPKHLRSRPGTSRRGSTADGRENQPQEGEGSNSRPPAGSSDEENDADDDSGDSDRVDQGPSVGHRHPDASPFRQKLFKRSPSVRSDVPPRSNPASPNVGLQRSPHPLQSPDPSATPRPQGSARTPSSRRRRDPSPPPELHLPDASAPAGSSQSHRRVAIGESTVISPDSSMDEDDNEHEQTGGSSDDRPSDEQNRPQNESSAQLLDGHELSGSPELHGSPGVPQSTSRSRASSVRDGRGVKSPKIQAAIGSLRRATLGGPDPPASEQRSEAGGAAQGVKRDPFGVRFPQDLDQLRDCLYQEEINFFDLLDRQYDKVDDFYRGRFNDAERRFKELHGQLDELAEHRRIYHEALGEGKKQGPMGLLPNGLHKMVDKRISDIQSMVPDAIAQRNLQPGIPPTREADKGKHHERAEKLGAPDDSGVEDPEDRERIARAERQSSLTPELYQRYKRKLRMALTEYYKELETLKNYRILNMTGFKKALKKFEKTAKIHCLDLYMSSKISKGSFADGEPLDELLKEIEDIFTARFERGNHKKAVNKLRGQFSPTSHHFSVFRSGCMIGIGAAGFLYGLVRSFNPEVRAALPQWNALLLVYSVFFIPIVFALLFELNLAAFVAARINYTFIMEIDFKTALDYRQFMEIPALLFVVFAYCFCFSIERVGNPFAWPMVWLGFTIAFFINPLPIYYRHARFWFLKLLGRCFTPGLSRVEFITFFLADELNSLVYSFSNFWFVCCTYNKGWAKHPDMFAVCKAGGNPAYSILLLVPAFIRAIQCLKRYKDTHLPIHLVNAGKYTSVMLQYAFYANWRAKGLTTKGYPLPVWITFAIISSVYTSGWDLFVDWGLLRPRHKLLRESLGFAQYKQHYYVAMVTNVIIRFYWIGYIPITGVDFRLRNFIFACLEMLRRWQWNFYRVETEQVGNTDQYRISKDVPLPYRLEASDSEDDDLNKRKSGTPEEGIHDIKMSLRKVGKPISSMRRRMTGGRNEDGKKAQGGSEV